VNKTISLTVLLDGEASVAEARGSTYTNIGEVTGTGSAKKHPKDKPDNTIGYNLAVARALRALADEYEKRADWSMSSLGADNIFLMPNSVTINGHTLTQGV